MSRLVWLEVCGFRAFGTEARRFDFSNNIVVIHAQNSQGKTSLLEALEFLLTGSTSRRALLGSAAAEFEGSLRNVHTTPSQEVSVAAGLQTSDGRVCVIRRVLLEDCSGQRDCRSVLSVDGIQKDELPSSLGITLSAPPIATPVLFQHTLRYVMSAKPQERVDYFKRIFELENLDHFRNAVDQARAEQSQSRTPNLDALERTPRGRSLRQQLEATVGDEPALRATLMAALSALDPDLRIGNPMMGEEDLHGIVEHAKVVLEKRRNVRSPLPLLALPDDVLVAARQNPRELEAEPLQAYARAVAEVDQAQARLVPLFERALALPALTSAQEGDALDCPLCLTPAALTHARIEQIREELLALRQVSQHTVTARQALDRERDLVRALWRHAGSVPSALNLEGRAELDRRVLALGLSPEVATDPLETSRLVQEAGNELRSLAESYGRLLGDRVSDLEGHRGLDVDQLHGPAADFRVAVASWQKRVTEHIEATSQLARLVSGGVDASLGLDGWVELIVAGERVDTLVAEVGAERTRQAVLAQLNRALADIDAGIRAVLDRRFEAMSEAMTRWWLTLRPAEELVGFSGVRRRGAGRRFLDIKAALRPRTGEQAVERDAVAVASDSQLNALGLAAFLARTSLAGGGWLALDDAVPGSDIEHRSTFASNTVTALREDGLQVIIATHDSELARLLVDLHRHVGVDQFELALDDGRVGPDVVKVSDRFAERLAAGKGLARSGLAQHRRQAAVDLRTAAEILAKAIVATARRAEGRSGDVSDLGGRNLATLVDLVLPYVVMSEEPGYWNTLRRLLNPGGHDDPNVPAPNDLTTASGQLQAIHRWHKEQQRGFRTD
jgi:hypothetical protein